MYFGRVYDRTLLHESLIFRSDGEPSRTRTFIVRRLDGEEELSSIFHCQRATTVFTGSRIAFNDIPRPWMAQNFVSCEVIPKFRRSRGSYRTGEYDGNHSRILAWSGRCKQEVSVFMGRPTNDV